MAPDGGLSRRARELIRRVLEAPKFELLPFKSAVAQAGFLPEGALVSVTASPTMTLERTFDVAADLCMRGFDVVPHLSARMTRDRRHLASLLQRMDDLEISRVFVVGGDAPQQGDFPDGYSLLSAMAEIGHDLAEIGVPCYPEGHATIPEENLGQALHDKQPHAPLHDDPDVLRRRGHCRFPGSLSGRWHRSPGPARHPGCGGAAQAGADIGPDRA